MHQGNDLALWIDIAWARLWVPEAVVRRDESSRCCRRPVSASVFKISAEGAGSLPAADGGLHAAPSQRRKSWNCRCSSSNCPAVTCCSSNTAASLIHSSPLRVQTGGMKCLVEHVKLLKLRGHKVVAVHRSDAADTAMPPWTDITASVDVVCRLHQRLNDVYKASDIDVVVVGIFHQVPLSSTNSGLITPHQFQFYAYQWLLLQ